MVVRDMKRGLLRGERRGSEQHGNDECGAHHVNLVRRKIRDGANGFLSKTFLNRPTEDR